MSTGLSFQPTPLTFGAKAATTVADKPKAKLWMNLGYESDHVNEETGKPYFISLPQGIPLDTQEPTDTNVRSPEFAAIRNAQNNLLDQLLEATKDMAPGEERFITMQIQVRHIKDAVAPIDPQNNPLIKKLSF